MFAIWTYSDFPRLTVSVEVLGKFSDGTARIRLLDNSQLGEMKRGDVTRVSLWQITEAAQ